MARDPNSQSEDPALVQDSDEVAVWSDRPIVRWAMAFKGRPAALVALFIAVFILIYWGDTLEPWRNFTFDAHHQAAPRSTERLPVQIVEIDEASLQEFGQWPWPRHLVADLIQGVSVRGAIVVGLDLIFPEPDRLSPHAVVQGRPEVSDDVVAALQSVPSNDEAFAAVIGRLPVVLGRASLAGEVAEAWVDKDPPMPPTGLSDASLLAALPKGDAVVTNLPMLEERAIGFGILNGPPDEDGVVRRVPLAMNVGGQPHGTMILEVLRVALGAPEVTFLGSDGVIEGVDIGGNFFPTDKDGRIRPHFTHSLEGRFISAGDVLAGRVAQNEFENQVVLIGVTGIGVIDKRSTPVSALVHGVEIQAQVLENLLEGNRLVRPDWAEPSEAALLIIISAIIILLMPIRPIWQTGLFFVCAIAVAGGLTHFAFVSRNYLIDPLLPSLLSALIFLSMLSILLAEMDRRRRALRQALQQERVVAARVAGELKAARDIQLGILPNPNAIEGLPSTVSVNAFLESAKEVGGDLYDLFMIDDKRLFFLVGDVTGKGVPASLFMALSKAMSKSAALRGADQAMDAIFDIANAEISRENPASLFVTVFAGVVDAETGYIEFCNAGHEDPHILSADGTVRPLQCDGGPPLCVFEGFPYPLENVTLAPGETLLVTTDGVTEARRADGALYGHDRLLSVLSAASTEPDLDHAVSNIVRDVRDFEAGVDPTDDLTVLAVRFTGQ